MAVQGCERGDGGDSTHARAKLRWQCHSCVDDVEGESCHGGQANDLGEADNVALLQAKHAAGEHQFGVDGETGKVVDMKEYGLYESAAVKVQTIKTAIEVGVRGRSYSYRHMLI